MLSRKSLFVCLVAALLSGCANKSHLIKDVGEKRQNRQIEIAALEQGPAIVASDIMTIESTASNTHVRSDKVGMVDIRLRIKAKAIPGAVRPPINLALVVDTSASMEGAAMDDAKKACAALVEKLSPGDRLSLIAFHSGVDVLVPSTVLTKKSIEEILRKIAAMKPYGTTNLAGGLSAGLAEARKNFRADGINRVVLLGDGVPNDGTSLPALAQSAGQSKIAITTLGLGLDYDETIMSTIALNSGGKYHFIKESSKVARMFQDEVLRLERVVARGVTLKLGTGPGVGIQSVVGLPVASSSVVIGDMIEGEERDVVVRVAAPARHDGSVVELLDAEVSMDHPHLAGTRLADRTFVAVKSTTDANLIAQGRNRDVERSAARTDLADRIVRAVAAARSGNLQQGIALLDAAEREAKVWAKELEDPVLAEKVESLGPLRRSLPSLVHQIQIVPPVATRAPGLPMHDRPSMQAPMMPAPAAAAIVMDAQADAMSALQGH